jgi:hypothetical protein
MARLDVAAVAKRLYESFLAPLVVGGAMTPGPPVGALAALSLEGAVSAVDPDVRSHVDMARVRVARRLVPIDTVDEPGPSDWALGAALHDMVHALNPELDGLLHRSAPEKLLDLAEQVIDRVAAPASLADALSRHTFFARTFEIQRTDTVVSWWTGSRTFLGSEPPPRLLAWPELRRVHTDQTKVPLARLPTAHIAGAAQRHARGSARTERFEGLIGRWLEKDPLTDLATVTRDLAPFEWHGGSLGLFATRGGRALGLRALALGPRAPVDAALGRASRTWLTAGSWETLARVADVLAERALAVAAAELSSTAEGDERDVSEDAHFARVFGATAALASGRVEGLGSPGAVRRVTARLMPLAQTVRGRELAEALRKVPELGRVAPPD